MGDIAQILAARGIELDPNALADAIEASIQEAGVPPYPDPSEHLTSEELDLLAKGGFEEGDRVIGIRDPIILGAIDFAVLRLTALDTKAAATRLKVNDSRIRQRLSHRELYGIKVGDGWRLPVFQFVHDGLVPNIERVIPKLDPSLSPVAVFRWFTLSNPDLALPDGTKLSPLQWLVSGHDPEVAAELAHWL